MIVLRALALTGRLVRAASRRAPSMETPLTGFSRLLTWLAMACAAAVCVALALSAASFDIGAGMVAGGLLALVVTYWRRLRSRW